MFVHQPGGTFDLTGGPKASSRRFAGAAALPLDIFIVTAREPARILAEYARLTGHPEMPPLWSLGYQQSHRTLASRDVVLSIAKTFREKKLPCDVLIYLGTGFCPSGWNTGHGSFAFNPTAFPDPKPMLDELHKMHFHVVPHVVIRATIGDGPRERCLRPRIGLTSRRRAATGTPIAVFFALGVDGWWPDEGDPLDGPSRLARIRMYWEGCQIDRPDARPYALHRNGYAGMQRYAAFPLVGRCLFDVGDAQNARAGGDQHRPDGNSLLGNGHRRLRADQGIDGRALRPLVSVRRVLPAVSIARPHLDAAAALGLEHRRAWS